MARGSENGVIDNVALIQFERLPMPHVVRVVAPFPDGTAAEMWAVEHGYRDYVIAPLSFLDSRSS